MENKKEKSVFNKNWLWLLFIALLLLLAVILIIVYSKNKKEQQEGGTSIPVEEDSGIENPSPPTIGSFNIIDPSPVFKDSAFTFSLKNDYPTYKKSYFIDGTVICINQKTCITKISKLGKHTLKICFDDLGFCDTINIKVLPVQEDPIKKPGSETGGSGIKNGNPTISSSTNELPNQDDADFKIKYNNRAKRPTFKGNPIQLNFNSSSSNYKSKYYINDKEVIGTQFSVNEIGQYTIKHVISDELNNSAISIEKINIELDLDVINKQIEIIYEKGNERFPSPAQISAANEAISKINNWLKNSEIRVFEATERNPGDFIKIQVGDNYTLNTWFRHLRIVKTTEDAKIRELKIVKINYNEGVPYEILYVKP